MPIYNYKCDTCNHIFEMNKKISERDNIAEDVCPECCGVGNITRQVGAPLVAYSVTIAGGYGKPSDGWKEVLRKIDTRAPGSRMKETSSFL